MWGSVLKETNFRFRQKSTGYAPSLGSEGACVIGRVVNENKGIVTALTTLGTEVFIPEPGNELLPRIC